MRNPFANVTCRSGSGTQSQEFVHPSSNWVSRERQLTTTLLPWRESEMTAVAVASTAGPSPACATYAMRLRAWDGAGKLIVSINSRCRREGDGMRGCPAALIVQARYRSGAGDKLAKVKCLLCALPTARAAGVVRTGRAAARRFQALAHQTRPSSGYSRSIEGGSTLEERRWLARCSLSQQRRRWRVGHGLTAARRAQVQRPRLGTI